MGKHKIQYKLKPYENFESSGHIGIVKDEHGRDVEAHIFVPVTSDTTRVDSMVGITMCMLSHPAFKDLKPRQRLLYLYAKAQYKGMVDRNDFEKAYPQYKGHKEYVYLNSYQMINVFEMYTKHTARELYKDITVLTEHGFLVPVGYDEKSQRIIYKLIGEWQNWEPHKKYVPRLGKSKVPPKENTKRIKQDCFDYEWREVV